MIKLAGGVKDRAIARVPGAGQEQDQLADVWLCSGPQLLAGASWPPGAARPGPVALADGVAPPAAVAGRGRERSGSGGLQIEGRTTALNVTPPPRVAPPGPRAWPLSAW
jgi:hypothetical protein